MLMRRSLALSMVSFWLLCAPSSPSTGSLSHQHPWQLGRSSCLGSGWSLVTRVHT